MKQEAFYKDNKNREYFAEREYEIGSMLGQKDPQHFLQCYGRVTRNVGVRMVVNYLYMEFSPFKDLYGLITRYR